MVKEIRIAAPRVGELEWAQRTPLGEWKWSMSVTEGLVT
jgi:hypothetical protein